MNIKKTRMVYFSPTGTTKKILRGITNGLQYKSVDHLDLTTPSSETDKFNEFKDNELAIIGVPVYAGRVPATATKRLKRLKANKTPAVIVAVYGNRAYDDALLELKDLSSELGFVPIAGGAFIGEHSFSSDITPIAPGRPDIEDLAEAKKFGKEIEKKLQKLDKLKPYPKLEVPGDFPYKPLKSLSEAPITNEDVCTHCKSCITICPTSAISFNGTILTDSNACIKCCACVKACPTKARTIPEQIKSIAQRLNTNCSERREPEFY